MTDLLEDPDGAPYPEPVQAFVRMMDQYAIDIREPLVAALESVADHYRAEVEVAAREARAGARLVVRANRRAEAAEKANRGITIHVTDPGPTRVIPVREPCPRCGYRG